MKGRPIMPAWVSSAQRCVMNRTLPHWRCWRPGARKSTSSAQNLAIEQLPQLPKPRLQHVRLLLAVVPRVDVDVVAHDELHNGPAG